MLHLILVINTCYSKDMIFRAYDTVYICSMCAHMYVAIIMDVDRSTCAKAYGKWLKRASCHNYMYKYENIHTCAGILRIRVCINCGSKTAEHSASYVAVISLSKLAMSNTQVSVRLLLIRPPRLTC